MKISTTLFLIIFLAICSILYSEILFNFEVSLSTYDFGEVNDIRLIDFDNDDVDDYCVQFEDAEYLRQVIYNCDGDTLKIFECTNTTKNANSICEFNNQIYYLEINYLGSQFGSYPHVSIFDNNCTLIDSISLPYQLTQVSYLNEMASEVKNISFVNQNIDLAILIGFERHYGMGTQEYIDTRALHLTFNNNELSFEIAYNTVSISDYINNSTIITNSYDEYNISATCGRSLELRIVNIETHSWQTFYECSGWMGMSNPNPTWVYTFDIVSFYENNEDVIFAYKSKSNNNAVMNFISRDINTNENEWEIIEPFNDNIVSSTILNHPNGEDYIMYFYPTVACLRNVATGSIYYQEINQITPQYILDNQNNDKLFFQVINNAIIVYTIDSNIVVGVTNDNIGEIKLSLNNYPNPFNPSTTIEFSIQNDSKVELLIYNIKGQKTKTLLQNELTNGTHSVTWNGDDESGKSVSSGIYYYKLKINGKTEAVKKCLLLK